MQPGYSTDNVFFIIIIIIQPLDSLNKTLQPKKKKKLNKKKETSPVRRSSVKGSWTSGGAFASENVYF